MNVSDKAQLAIDMVASDQTIAFDVETNGLDWKRDEPIGYVVTSDDLSVYVPVRHSGGGNLALGEFFESELAKTFQEREAPTVGHNIKFDAHFAANKGIMLGRNLRDTQNYATLIDDTRDSHSLENVAESVGAPAKRGKELYEHMAAKFGGAAERSQMENYHKLPGTDPLAVDYAEGDGVSTLATYRKQLDILDSMDCQTVKDIEDQLTWTLFRMERKGVKVDTEYLEETKKQLETRIDEAGRALPEGFNARSGAAVKEWMEANGHHDFPRTEAGNPSFPENYLKRSEAGRHVAALRKLRGLISRDIDPMIDRHVFEGRVHTTFNQLKGDESGTIARLSATSPALQCVPKRDEELGRIFRKAFVADVGYRIWEADYSQCEPRLFGCYSGDHNLLSGYNAGTPRDAHDVCADLLGLPRGPAKTLNMSIFNGMQKRALGERMDCTQGEAQLYLDRWDAAFPAIADFRRSANQRFADRGWVTTILGRVARSKSFRDKHKGVSRIIQGSNADILKYQMVRVDKWLEENHPDIHMILSIHDAISWLAPDNILGDDVSKEIVVMLQDFRDWPGPELAVPFPVDFHSGHNWAEASYG